MSKDSTEQYVSLFRDYHKLLDAGSCDVMNAHRETAAALLSGQRLPDTKTERYKYTNAAECFAPDYGLNLRRIPTSVNPYETYRCSVPGLSSLLMFVINDTPFDMSKPSKDMLPDGVIVDSFCKVAATRNEILEKYYNHAASKDRDFRTGHDGVTLLNTMLAQDGVLIYIPAHVKLRNPIQIVNIATGGQPMMSVRRIVVVAGEGVEAAVLLCDHADGETQCLTTQVVEAYVEKEARLDIFSIEETRSGCTRFSTLYAEQEEGSRVNYDGITLTCGQSRNRIDVRLRGERASAGVYGAVIADGRQRADNNIIVEHLAPKCTSDMLYKYVLDDGSTGAFAGKVYVAPGAQQTVSQQTNANLCAAPGARAFSQPMLEIYADDVKCNHGSTVGKLDESALFYMRQRGIPEKEARLLLQHAFINEVLRHVRLEQLQERLSRLVELRFKGELQKCRGCRGCVPQKEIL